MIINPVVVKPQIAYTYLRTTNLYESICINFLPTQEWKLIDIVPEILGPNKYYQLKLDNIIIVLSTQHFSHIFGEAIVKELNTGGGQ